MRLPVPLSLLLLLSGSLVQLPARAGDVPAPEGPGIIFEGSLHYGYVWAHAGAVRHLSRTYFPMYQLALSRQVSGAREWHHLYDHPELGMSLMVGALGYPEVLGTSYSLFPHMRRRLHETTHVQLNIRYGLGAAYLTKPFHRTENYRNTAVGSALNIAFHSRLEVGFKHSGGGRLLMGLGLTHFSNGSVRKPNKGLNIPAFCMAYSFPPGHGMEVPLPSTAGEAEKPDAESSTHGQKNRIHAVISLAGGFSGIYSSDDVLYPAASLAATTSLSVSKKSRIGLGGDLFVNMADPATKALEEPGPAEGNRVAEDNRIKGGAHLSYEQVFGNLDFVFQTGVYLVNPHKVGGPIYNRIGFRYTLPGNMVMHICLKSHKFTASFIEIGAGYRFFNQ